MSEEFRVLRVPQCLRPIVDVHEQVAAEDPYPPFFGYAPSETPVRTISCPDCGKPVSAAHLHLHHACHETTKQEPIKVHDHFQLQIESPLGPQTPCAYARRHAYPFQTLFDRDANK
jgi:hypothetical protein